MRFHNALVLALPALSSAYPGLMGVDSRAEMEAMLLEKRNSVEFNEKREPQLLSGLIGTVGALTNTINGLLGSVAAAVDPSNKRPEPGYTFQAPGPGDSRGPCPGLNLLANYGYLPRNGYVNYGQVLTATARGFNMAADLAAVLATFAVLTDGDIATESWYLGTNPNSKVGGLNRHSTVEADVSPNREDLYLGCGDNHHLSSRLFKQNVGYAAAGSKQFDLATMGNHYAASAAFSQKNNPYLYYFPFPMIVSLGGFAFYPNFFSNGTYGAGGVANYESISSIIGAQYDSKTGNFKYVPEKWPENWYRRATPYGAVETLLEGYTSIYLKYVLPPGVPQLGGPNFDAKTVLCDVFMGLNSITPLSLAGQTESFAAGITWAVSKLAPYFSATVLGCPASALSPNAVPLFPNATRTGGPLGTPSAQAANEGNNVYNKVYFTSAPTTPQCSHSS